MGQWEKVGVLRGYTGIIPEGYHDETNIKETTQKGVGGGEQWEKAGVLRGYTGISRGLS